MGLFLFLELKSMPATDHSKILEKELLLKKMKAESNDEIKMLNPYKEDYSIKYDNRYWVVPAAVMTEKGKKPGELVGPRYIAMHYFKHKIDQLITLESKRKMKPFFEKYKEKGDMEGYYKFEERTALRTDDEGLRAKYLKVLYGGVIRKFGLDEDPAEESQLKPKDSRHKDYAILEELEVEKNKFISQIKENEPKK